MAGRALREGHSKRRIDGPLNRRLQGEAQVSLPETGTYVLTVTANDIVSTGSYNLGFERLSP